MNRPELDRNRSTATGGKISDERRVIFTVGVAGELFGLPIDCVRTIFRSPSVTPVPLAPKRMIGLINLRGQVVTAICLRESLGYARPQSGEWLMVAIEHRNESFALAVDSVGDVLEVSESQKLAIPQSVTAARRAVTAAIYHTQDALIPVLNINVLLDATLDSLAA